jgi:predicted transcriptional regulator
MAELQRREVTRSRLASLRMVMPRRALTFCEALQLAELQANRLLELEEQSDFPTPEDLITAQPRLQVTRSADLPGSGRTRWRQGRWHIELNATEPYLRQRFTLAHEYKHVLDAPFDRLIYGGFDAEERDVLVEQVSDYFAACLLMPKRLVKRLWGQGFRTAELAEVFVVSLQAMSVRVRTLGLVEPNRRHSRPIPSTYWPEAAELRREAA